MPSKALLTVKFMLCITVNNFEICGILLALSQWFLTFFASGTPKVSIGTIGRPLNPCKRGLKWYNTLLLWSLWTPNALSADPRLRAYALSWLRAILLIKYKFFCFQVTRSAVSWPKQVVTSISPILIEAIPMKKATRFRLPVRVTKFAILQSGKLLETYFLCKASFLFLISHLADTSLIIKSWGKITNIVGVLQFQQWKIILTFFFRWNGRRWKGQGPRSRADPSDLLFWPPNHSILWSTRSERQLRQSHSRSVQYSGYLTDQINTMRPRYGAVFKIH